MGGQGSNSDVYRVRLVARFKKQLVDALKSLPASARAPANAVRRRGAGGYEAMLFVDLVSMERLRGLDGVNVADVGNLSAQLREPPRELPN